MNQKSELLLRYEKMLRGEIGEWFDTDEYDEIAFEYESLSMFEDALQAIEIGLKCHPMSEDLLIRKSYYLLIVGRADEARSTISAVTSDDEEAQLIRAELFLIDNDVDSAVKIVKDILKECEITTDVILNVVDLCADYKLFSKLFDTIEEVTLKIPAKQRLQLYREIMKTLEEESETALQSLVVEKILDMDPYSIPDWIKAIEIYISLSDIPKAMEAIEYAIAIDEKNPEPYFYKAFCCMDNGDYEQAVSIIESLDKDKDENLYTMLATCYTKMRKYSKSTLVLKESIDKFGENSRNLYILAQNTYNTTNNTDEVLRILKRAENLDPYSSDIVYMLARVYYDCENYSQALEALKRLSYTDYDETDNRAIILRGDVEMKLGNPKNALEYYNKVFSENSYDIETCLKMIYAYSELHDVENMQKNIDFAEDIMASIDVNGNMTDEVQQRIIYIRSTIDKIKVILRNHIDNSIQ